MIRAPLCALLTTWLVSALPCQRIADGVEPHVREAFVAAWARLPEPWRAQLVDVELHRAPSLGVPADAPLSALLLDRAATAFFSNVGRRIHVTDAGANGRPRWGRAQPSPEVMAAFLLDELDVGDEGEGGEGEREQRLAAAWRWFVGAVYGWRGEPVPEPLPPLGAVEVLDRFLDDGVRRALGGEVPLEQLLFHELAHAVQNHLQRMIPHIEAWATLSDWRERADDRPTDGYSGGMFAMEQPAVLIRLLLDLPRGPATYAPRDDAGFVDRYARFDLREDFAECARLMAYEPERLAATAPSRFLFLDALGWSARLDARQPGPRWLTDERLATPVMQAAVAAGASALLREDERAPPPLMAAALLRAHQDLLRGEALPPAHAPGALPTDLPPTVRARFDVRLFCFDVDGVPRSVAPARVAAACDEQLVRWLEHRAFAEGLEPLLDSSAERLVERHRKEVLDVDDPAERQERFDVLVPSLRDKLPAADCRALCLAEAAHVARNDPLAALRYRLFATGAWDPAWDRLVDAAPAEHGAVEALAARAELELRAGDRDAARSTIARIGGQALGALRRVGLLLACDDAAAAEAAAIGVAMPRLRDHLLQLVAQWHRDHGDDGAAERVLGLRR